MRRRLPSSERAKLYEREAEKARAAGRGVLPICNICDCPIDGATQAWDESHDPAKPRFLGGAVTGIAHRRCNRTHNNRHDTPLYASGNRKRWRAMGAYVPARPMAGSRSDRLKRTLDGRTIERATGEVVYRGRSMS